MTRSVLDPFTGAKTKKGCICKQTWSYKGDQCAYNGWPSKTPASGDKKNLGCCNPDGDSGGAWCYVVGGSCATGMTSSGVTDYDYCPSTKTGGKWTATQTKSFEALGDHNACRNPDGDSGKIWCYVSDKKWEYCEPLGTLRVVKNGMVDRDWCSVML